MRRAARQPVPQFIGRLRVAVTKAGALGLVAKLLVHVRQQTPGLFVLRLRKHEAVKNLCGLEVLALGHQLLALGDDVRRASHHLDIQRRRILRRQRHEIDRVAIVVAEEAVDDSARVVLRVAVVAAGGPLLLAPVMVNVAVAL